MTTQELISKYDIFDPQNGSGTIGIRNRTACMRDNALEEIKTRKPEILAYFEAKRRAEAEAKADRERRIAEIDGLAELKTAIADLSKWEAEFEASFCGENACGGLGVRPRPSADIEAMKKAHPRAAAYLAAEDKMYSSNYEISAIGKKFLEEVIYGDYEKALAGMKKDMDAFVARHIVD